MGIELTYPRQLIARQPIDYMLAAKTRFHLHETIRIADRFTNDVGELGPFSWRSRFVFRIIC